MEIFLLTFNALDQVLDSLIQNDGELSSSGIPFKGHCIKWPLLAVGFHVSFHNEMENVWIFMVTSAVVY